MFAARERRRANGRTNVARGTRETKEVARVPDDAQHAIRSPRFLTNLGIWSPFLRPAPPPAAFSRKPILDARSKAVRVGRVDRGCYPQPALLHCYMHGVAWHPTAGAPSQLRHPRMVVLPVRGLTTIKTQKFYLKRGSRSEVRSAPRRDFFLHRVGRVGLMQKTVSKSP